MKMNMKVVETKTGVIHTVVFEAPKDVAQATVTAIDAAERELGHLDFMLLWMFPC